MYDAIVVGARCAGSPTAMLLARKGYNVLLVDRATFPSDTVSTHIIWPHGVEHLDRWGLRDPLAATGVPPICRSMIFDVGPIALRGMVPAANEGKGGLCPRRTVLDKLLVDAAVTSGVEVREGFSVDELLFEGDAVVGLRGHVSGGRPITERARIVIGADGVHSRVAAAVAAPAYDERPILECAYYSYFSYFSGVDQDDMELYIRDFCALGAVPTHGGLHLVMVNWPAQRFMEVRADIERHVMEALQLAPGLAERVRQGTREEPWYGTAGVPNFFRKPYGPGWALVGDAGYSRDPMTAQGISDAFIDAASLADAVDAGLAGRRSLPEALAEYETARNDRVRPMFEFTCQIASLEPPPQQMQQLFGALHGNQEATNQFFSAISGATSLADFMAAENLARIMSPTGAALTA
jgi:2-polyprenyl-6-methoxyphenol hydroxylase-like FAD-dependent oxidoreductase